MRNELKVLAAIAVATIALLALVYVDMRQSHIEPEQERHAR